MIKKFKKVELTVVYNDNSGMTSQRAMSGSMTIDNYGGKVCFTEAAPRPSKQRNTKVFDGSFLSVVRKGDGTMVMHSKAVDPTKVDDLAERMLQEAIHVQEKVNEIRKG